MHPPSPRPPLPLQPAGMEDRLGIARRLGAALEHQVAGRLEGEAVEVRRHRPVEAGSPAFWRSTTAAIRCMTSRTCSSLTTPWCSQLAMCWAEMRQVARSSIRPTSLMSGTLEQPTPWSIQRTT